MTVTPDSPKYGYPNNESRPTTAYHALGSPILQHTEPTTLVVSARTGSRHSLEGAASVSSNSAGSSPATAGNSSSNNNNNSSNNNNNNNGLLTPKIEDVKSEVYGGEPLRQTVLMWGAPPTAATTPPRNNGSYSPPARDHTPMDSKLFLSLTSRKVPGNITQDLSSTFA